MFWPLELWSTSRETENLQAAIEWRKSMNKTTAKQKIEALEKELAIDTLGEELKLVEG